MKNAYTTLGFALGASASLHPRDQCCFSLNAAGGQSGVVGQLGDGQNRIGQSGGLANQQGTYCLSNGGLTDQSGRGCILTPPTTQFQCDVGASPTNGFSVNSNGDLTYNGNTQFYACATGDNGGYNIYTVTTGDQTGCVKITLNTGGQCIGGGGGNGGSSAPASSAPPASQPAISAPPASKPASSAPPASQPPAPAPPASKPAPSAPPPSAPPSGSASQGTPCATHNCPNGPGTFITVTPSTYPTSYVVNGQTVIFTAQPSSCMAMSTGGGNGGGNGGGGNQPPANNGAGNQPPATNGGGNGDAQPPGPMQTSTIYQTTYYATVYSCPPEVGDCPATNVGVSGGQPTAPASQPATTPAPSGPASQPAGSKPAASGPAPSGPASQPAASAPPPSGTSTGNGGNGNGKACPTALTGAYQTPHAIIPINKDQPGTSYGTQYNAYISSSNSTIFNFDIPASYSGKQCSVIFLFPKKSDLETSDFTMSGSGGMKFDQLASPAPLTVSYSSCPAVSSNMGTIASVTPGNSYIVATGACQPGTTMSILASGTGGMSLTVRPSIQSILVIILLTLTTGNPSPIGVYITSC
ncbi:hypothetical protein E4T38_02985 [Aureobasidium subglaciale]|nr:hypothetical protein E4T38_02985 [Aureobasidium subglaciale]KAI5214108.1 hypothetical protein E4T41_09964 [Aureobasidium subglaciale]KAI5226840.1 hypothetical protein E4T40_02759 [Aureobasidium subglaciale]KAI5252288.1 hypothetical protein E4T46_09956 [Aureobasidium subglaciale]